MPARPVALTVPRIAHRQGGVFTAAQARAEGFSDRTIRYRISEQRWVYVAGRALSEPGAPWTAFQLGMGAQLSIPRAVISHITAGLLQGFPMAEAPAVCDVILDVHRRTGRAIRPHLLRLAETETCLGPAGLRLTSPVRTALDCLAFLPFGPALDLWAWLATRHVLSMDDLAAAIKERKNWHGIAQLTRIHTLSCDGALSQAEFLLLNLLRQARLSGWIANAPLEDASGRIGIVDVLFRAARLVVEVDGWRAHASRTSFVADRRRQNRLIAAGYTVLRFTWDDLTQRPARVLAEIRACLNPGSGRGFRQLEGVESRDQIRELR